MKAAERPKALPKIPLPQSLRDGLRNKTFRYYTIGSVFTLSYFALLDRARKSDIEMMKVGAAGSLTMLVAESAFYCIDAVNARSKMLETNVGLYDMTKRI